MRKITNRFGNTKKYLPRILGIFFVVSIAFLLSATESWACTISGYVKLANGMGVSGVKMNGLPGPPTTNSSGFYSATVNIGWYGWSGTVTPTKTGYTFDPTSRTYTKIKTSQSNQNYTATINKTTPTITWANPADITYGTALNGTHLNATASVQGTFLYTPPSGTVLNAGSNQNLHVDFTPTDTAKYNNASKDVKINVLKATPVITWANPADITYPTALGATQLNATASVPGTFVYTPASGTVLNAGPAQTLSVAFTPTDTANYNNASADVTIVVLKSTPIITWDNPADITYPTALGDAQLNATANVPGEFNYTLADQSTSASCAVLNPGSGQSLNVKFTPTDPNYDIAYKTVEINVLVPYVTKEQISGSWICTQSDASGYPVAVYLCPSSDCDTCMTGDPTDNPNRCANSSLAYVGFGVTELKWGGPGSETVDFVTSKTVDSVTSKVIYRCIEGIDLCFSCGDPLLKWTCDPSIPDLLSTPTFTGTAQQKIGNVWVCAESPDESGCFTTVYSCPGATDQYPCACENPESWLASLLSFNAGELQWVGPGSDNLNCETVYFVTLKTLNSVPTSCIYKCISDTDICFAYPQNCAIPPE